MVSNEDRQEQGCTDKRQDTVWEAVGRDRERSKKTYFRLQDAQRRLWGDTWKGKGVLLPYNFLAD